MDCKAGDGENPPSSQDVKAAIKEKSFPNTESWWNRSFRGFITGYQAFYLYVTGSNLSRMGSNPFS